MAGGRGLIVAPPPRPRLKAWGAGASAVDCKMDVSGAGGWDEAPWKKLCAEVGGLHGGAGAAGLRLRPS